MKTKLKQTSSKHGLRCDIDLQLSIGSIKIQIPWLDPMVVCESVQVANADVPFSVGLEPIDKYIMVVHNVHNILKCYILGRKIPLTLINDHIYLEWNESQKMLYTYA